MKEKNTVPTQEISKEEEIKYRDSRFTSNIIKVMLAAIDVGLFFTLCFA